MEVSLLGLDGVGSEDERHFYYNGRVGLKEQKKIKTIIFYLMCGVLLPKTSKKTIRHTCDGFMAFLFMPTFFMRFHSDTLLTAMS